MKRAWWMLVFVAAALLRAADESRVVVMSPYEVTANTVQFKRWIKVTSPHFSVYTDVSAPEAMTIVREMEMLHFAAQRFFGRIALRRAPMIFVLPATGSEDAATEHLNRLIAANTTNPEVYALAAQRALVRHAPKIQPATRLGAEAAEEIRQLSLRALVLEPRNAAANNALAFAIALRPELEPDAIKSLAKLYRTLSGNAPTSAVVSALAIAHARAGDREAAREIAAILRDSKFSDPPARRLAAELLAELARPPDDEAKTASPSTPGLTVR